MDCMSTAFEAQRNCPSSAAYEYLQLTNKNMDKNDTVVAISSLWMSIPSPIYQSSCQSKTDQSKLHALARPPTKRQRQMPSGWNVRLLCVKASVMYTYILVPISF